MEIHTMWIEYILTHEGHATYIGNKGSHELNKINHVNINPIALKL